MKNGLIPLVSALLIAAPVAIFAHSDTPGLQGEHDMTGTVKRLNHKTGQFELVVAGAPHMHLHFPPDQLKDIKEGDTLTVHMAFTRPEKKK
jgi:hypothetical protein